MVKRLLSATVLSGVLIAGAGGAAFASPRPAATAHPHHARATAVARTRIAARKAVRAHRRAVRKVLRQVYRVTAVNGDTINAVTRAGQPVTITVGITTTYKEAGATTPTLSRVTPGESILVRGKRTAPRTFQATTVRILLARAAGVVTAVNGSALTVTGANGMPRTVNIEATTAITRAGVAALATDITPNTVILAAGAPNADGSLNATRIVIRAAHVAGKVTAVSGDGATITLQGAYGTTYTVSTSGSTVYARRQGKKLTPATASAVTVGRRIVAYGVRSADGASLSAQRIVIGRMAAATPAR